MPLLSSAEITFYFTDIEGSTRLWEQKTEAMQRALVRHDALLREIIEARDGYVFKTVGDAFCAAFARADSGLEAALAVQLAVGAEDWGETGPLKIRAALHTGEAEQRDNDFFGPTVNRVARLLAAGYGGQTLLSQNTYQLVCRTPPPGVIFKEMGRHRLKDLQEPEQIYQLLHPDLRPDFPPLKSLNTLPNNLPRQLTRFIGREKQVAEVKELLANTPLLTLMGTGGCGKTRLSLQVAADVLEQFPDGCWFIDLAPLTDPTLVTRTVAAVLGLREEPNRTLVQTLTHYLGSKQLLLILDNCEHLIEACARLTEVVLQSCPHVHILATSREALRIGGEAVYRIPSLSLPDLKAWSRPGRSDPERLSEYESVRLFTDRARLRKPDFAVTAANGLAVAQICCRLDGIPLALELAAARMSALTAEQISARLDQDFSLLSGGSRVALPRQQTLRSLIDWSYNLLTEQEKSLLTSLSVFAGGWTLEAAEAVGATQESLPPVSSADDAAMREESAAIQEWEVLDLLTALVDKSLVLAEETDGASRYRLLETIRQYSREKLTARGESAAVQARHLAWYVQTAEEAARHFKGADEARWLERIQGEYDNLRVAFETAKSAPDGVDAELRLASALLHFWYRRGYFHEGRALLEHVLLRAKCSGRAADCAQALRGAGILAVCQASYAEAIALFTECLNLLQHKGDRENEAAVLNSLGIVARYQGDYDAAYALYEQSLAIRSELNDRRGVGDLHANLGNLDGDQGNYESAYRHFEASRAIFRELQDREGEAHALLNMGYAALYQERYDAALPYLNESLQIYQALEEKRGIALALTNIGAALSEQGETQTARASLVTGLTLFQELGFQRGIAYALDAFARLAAKQGQAERALQLYGTAEGLRERLGLSLPPSERPRYARLVEEARGDREEAAVDALWAQGKSLPGEEAIRMALQESEKGEET